MVDRSFIDSEGESKLLIDGDTITDAKGDRFRIGGMDALETDKLVQDEDGNWNFKRGQAGGEEQADAIAKIIKEGNFTNVQYSGDKDTSEGSREIIGLSNAEGQDLVETLYATGVLQINEGMSDRALNARNEAELIAALYGEEAVPYSDIANEYQDHMNSMGKQFKTLAINEKYYDPELHTGVQFRDPNRTLDNKAIGMLGSASTSFDQGVLGLKEGLWGYVDAIGETFGSEMIENLGEAGVARAREKMFDAPEVILDYKEIDGIRTGFEYVLNNTAMMVPQVMLAFGSMAVAAPFAPVIGAGGAAVASATPLAIVMAGQTWNEMEGDRGIEQFVAASVGGVGMASLERFGLGKLIKPGQVLSKEGAEKVAQAIAKKDNIPLDEARSRLKTVVKQEVGKFTKDLAVRLNPEDIARFSVGEIGRRGLAGFGIEAGTEVAQDITQMGIASAVSDTTYSQEEAIDRMINAALAGGSVGAALGSANSIYRQGKNRLLAVERGLYSADRLNLIENKLIQDKANDPNFEQQSTEDIINEAEGLPATEENVRGKAHDSYKADQKGIINTIKNANEVADYVSALQQGAAKLVLASEKVAMNMEKLVNSPMALKIFSLVGADTTGRYYTGRNFKEEHDLMIGDMTALVDETGIANLFGYKKLTTKNVDDISQQLREFGASGDYDLFEAELLTNNYGAYLQAATYFNKNATQAQRRAAYESLKNLGLRDPADIKRYFDTARKHINKDGVIQINRPVDEIADMKRKYIAARQIKNSYNKAFELSNNEYTKEHALESSAGKDVGYRQPKLNYNPDYWWKHQGFNWKEVKANRDEFLAWAKKTLGNQMTSNEIDELYESIVRDGQGTVTTTASLINGSTYLPYSFRPATKDIATKDGFQRWASQNMFESLNRSRMETAKYASTTKYFGHGGRKLNNMFNRLQDEVNSPGSNITQEEFDQFAYYMTSIVDSAHGNFNRIESKKWAAVNSFLTSWSLMAGLPLAALSSFPETALLFFNVKNDVEFKAAAKQMQNQILQAFDKALEAEVQKTEQLLTQVGQSATTNSVVDRLATGERDVAFMRLHEAFFKGIGLTKVTQVQRRMAAGFAIDFVRSGFDILDLAPRIKEEVEVQRAGFAKPIKRVVDGGFDFKKFSDIEMRTYNQLVDLGLDVDALHDMMQDLNAMHRDQIFNSADRTTDDRADRLSPEIIRAESKRERAFRKAAKNFQSKDANLRDANVMDLANSLQMQVNDAMDLAVYRFVKERVQLPGAANRPLFFQDPHYQLFTQFNGFISTFTANLVPKLWNQQMRKGSVKVKYDTFALLVTMMALGGASQYLKDLIKFGKPTPYLDEIGYVQRAVYASGVLGQYEKLVDAAKPLYPSRDGSFDLIFGETGPTVRNIRTAFDATGDLLSGESERAVSKAAKLVPGLGPMTGLRYGISDALHGENPFPDVSVPTTDDIRDVLLK